MTTFADFVTERLRELALTQNQLAFQWQERVGNGEVSTYETRLSKLLNDDDDGYEFVLDKKDSPKRLAALADGLKVERHELQVRLEAARARQTLVLHPRLPDAQRVFFQKREALSDGAFSCKMLNGSSAGGDPREALRDLALSSRNSIIVIPDDRDRDFFKGAKLRISGVEAATPGFRLVAFPELIPRLEPRKHDDDGMPMIADPNTESQHRDFMRRAEEELKHRSSREPLRTDKWDDRINEADALGVPVTFRLDWLENRPTATDLRAAVIANVEKRPDGSGNNRDAKLPTYFWAESGRILAISGDEHALLQRVRQVHAVHEVASFHALVESVRKLREGLNPWRKGGSFDLSAELDALEAETKIRVKLDADNVRAAAARPDTSSYSDRATKVGVSKSADGDKFVHEVLDNLLGRTFHGTESVASVIFRLEAVRHASLVHVETDAWNAVVLANVGAGRLLRASVKRYPNEGPAPVTCESKDRGMVLDGGDVRMELMPAFDECLEGSVLRSVGRRRKEAADASWDDD